MDIPDPLPLRNIPVPREVSAVAGCSCGGLTFHRVQSVYDPPGSGCLIWDLPDEEQLAVVDEAEQRLASFTDGLNAKLRQALPGAASPNDPIESIVGRALRSGLAE